MVHHIWVVVARCVKGILLLLIIVLPYSLLYDAANTWIARKMDLKLCNFLMVRIMLVVFVFFFSAFHAYALRYCCIHKQLWISDEYYENVGLFEQLSV